MIFFVCPTLSVTASWVGLNAERWHGFGVGARGFHAVDPKTPGASWAGPAPDREQVLRVHALESDGWRALLQESSSPDNTPRRTRLHSAMTASMPSGSASSEVTAGAGATYLLAGAGAVLVTACSAYSITGNGTAYETAGGWSHV